MVIVTDPRKITIVGRSVHRDIFAKHISLSDAYTRITAFELQILGLSANAGVGENFTLLALHRVSFH